MQRLLELDPVEDHDGWARANVEVSVEVSSVFIFGRVDKV